jgi:hypothetical protein
VVRRIEADEFGGVGSVGEADAPRRLTAVPDLEGTRTFHMTADDSLLPLRESTRSVAYANTSSAERSTSMLTKIGGT